MSRAGRTLHRHNRCERLSTSTALADGDVLVGIDPQRLTLYVGRVAAP